MRDYNEKSISSTAQILADNSWRLRKFRTQTILMEKFGKKVVRKYAATEEANSFLKTIVMRERANAKYLKDHFDVLCGKLQGDYIEYEYMPCQSLKQKIAFELRENQCSKADELLRLYVQKVHALNKLHVCPKEFLSMVTQDTVENYNLEFDCLSRGLLDLTPRNILVEGSKWIVVDNEWSFDFPVPVVFTLFRAIGEMMIELQDEILRCTKKTRPAVGILARGLRTYYLPQVWVKYISDNPVSFQQMLKWEMGFQRYVTGSSSATVSHLKMNPRTKIHFPFWRLRSNIVTIRSMSDFLHYVPVVRQLGHFFERILPFLHK